MFYVQRKDCLMKTLLKNLMIGVAVIVVAACTRIESGQVGVQRDFSGEYSKESVPVGIHMTLLDTIYPYSIREITIGLKDLKPTTKNQKQHIHSFRFGF